MFRFNSTRFFRNFFNVVSCEGIKLRDICRDPLPLPHVRPGDILLEISPPPQVIYGCPLTQFSPTRWGVDPVMLFVKYYSQNIRIVLSFRERFSLVYSRRTFVPQDPLGRFFTRIASRHFDAFVRAPAVPGFRRAGDTRRLPRVDV